ncbi:MAG: OsmC family protein [Acidobacteriia bacterium]|nr:OsmC family protein [Terriglobia bacterium]
MEPKKTYKTFRYLTGVAWKSGRRAVVSSDGRPDIEVSSPPEFKGDAGFWTPEDMFVASVDLCTLMTFLAFAQRKELDFASYESTAEGVLEFVEGKYRFTEIILRPHLVLKSESDTERARQILDDAHKGCLVSNSITAAVKMLPEIRIAAPAA